MATFNVLSSIVVSLALIHGYISVEILVDETVLQRFNERLENLEARNKYLEERVQAQDQIERRQSMYEGPVTFTARIDQVVVDHIHNKQTIVFPKTVTQLGGGYSNVTGVFTAPLSGIYIFTSSLMDHIERQDGTGSMLHAEILHNGKVLGRVFAHAEKTLYRDQGAQTVFAEVQKGDRVWVRSIDNPDLSLGGDLYSTFSGYLLWQM